MILKLSDDRSRRTEWLLEALLSDKGLTTSDLYERSGTYGLRPVMSIGEFVKVFDLNQVVGRLRADGKVGLDGSGRLVKLAPIAELPEEVKAAISKPFRSVHDQPPPPPPAPRTPDPESIIPPGPPPGSVKPASFEPTPEDVKGFQKVIEEGHADVVSDPLPPPPAAPPPPPTPVPDAGSSAKRRRR